jgi:ribosomal protein L31
MGLENLTYLAKGCFLAGTLISTPTGERKIETLKKGDNVISYNEESGIKETSTIGEIDVLQRDKFYTIYTKDGTICATAEHPFYTDKGIVEVKYLTEDHLLYDQDHNEISIELITLDYESDPFSVYNLLDVTPNNNYFANGLLVHNKGCFLPDTEILVSVNMDSYPETVKIQDLKAGDSVVSYNEKTHKRQLSKVEEIDRLIADEYYIINDGIRTTADHPFYTTDGVRTVKELKVGDSLLRVGNLEEKILKIELVEEPTVIYNLLNVVPNHNYYADYYLVHNKGGGGGCFLAGTQITMENGNRSIEDVKSGDRLWTFNEKTRFTQLGTVERLEELQMPGYYIINDEIKTTEGHPFYTTNGIKKVVELREGDVLYKNYDQKTTIKSIVYVEESVTVYNLVNVEPNHNYLANGYLVHNKGSAGGHSSSSGGGKSSSGSSSKSSSGSSSSKPAAPKAGTSTAKPGAKVKGADGKEVQSSTKTPAKSDYKSSTGVVGDNGYTPRYNNGYTPPAGSVVYNRERDFMDYLPWIYLFSQDSPRNDSQVIMQPDGKEVQATPAQDGIDGVAIFSWIVIIALVLGAIGGIVWLVNRD